VLLEFDLLMRKFANDVFTEEECCWSLISSSKLGQRYKFTPLVVVTRDVPILRASGPQPPAPIRGAQTCSLTDHLRMGSILIVL
jgi:hypothetical protein